MSAKEIYQIRLTLEGTTPPIWRRLLVSAGMTLPQFHDILQIAMGWQNCHLHEFSGAGAKYGQADPSEPGCLAQMGWIDERKARVSQLLPEANARAGYLYDFGDGWRHEIVVEQVLPVDPRRAYPVCLEGKGAGPPEDCGGPHAYAAIREALSDPKHPQYWDMKSFYLDYQKFSLAAVNRGLRKRFPVKAKKAAAKKTAAKKTDMVGCFDPVWTQPGLNMVPDQASPEKIGPWTRVPITLTDPERRLLIRYVFPPDEVVDHLKSMVPGPGETREFHFTMFELSHMAGYMEREAEVARTAKLEERLRGLWRRILWVMDAYEVEE